MFSFTKQKSQQDRGLKEAKIDDKKKKKRERERTKIRWIDLRMLKSFNHGKWVPFQTHQKRNGEELPVWGPREQHELHGEGGLMGVTEKEAWAKTK